MSDTTYSVVFSISEKIAMENECLDIDTWIQNACHERARIAKDNVLKIAVDKFIENNIQIPLSKDDIIIEAFKNGWIKTVKEKNEEYFKQDQELLKYSESFESNTALLDSPDNLNI
jgi:hypothetical protein